MKIYENYPLAECTTFHLPASARRFIEFDTEAELRELLPQVRGERLFVMGGGSNLVFTTDFDGTIIRSRISFIDTIARDDESITLRVGSGVNWDSFVRHCVEQGYYGIENMSYIPGDVGASAVQNIGSYGVEVKDVITKVNTIEIATGESRTFDNAECRYAYRDSIFKHELKGLYVVTSVEYRLALQPHFTLTYGPLKELDPANLTLADVRQRIIDIRKAKLPDPKHIGSAGSFFMNPIVDEAKFAALKASYPDIPSYPLPDGKVKVPAGWLIEHAGLKGRRHGGAQVYEKQCLVLVNACNATGSDVLNLCREVIATVADKYGITLKPEANIL